MKRLLLLPPLCLTLAACGADTYAGDSGPESSDGVKITKTSTNTYEIYDPDSWPDHYIDRTCDKDGREVIGLDTPGEAYEYIVVVCGPQADTPGLTTPEPDDSFSP